MSETVLKTALNDLLWATLPLRAVLTGDRRAAYIAAFARATAALAGKEPADNEKPPPARDVAVRLHRECLDVCAALGVKPHDLVPHFNASADAGFIPPFDKGAALARLGQHVMEAAEAFLLEEKHG